MPGSCSRETVKSAIIMMAMFVPDSEQPKEVRTLGLSDEFKGNELISERDLQDYLDRYKDLRDE